MTGLVQIFIPFSRTMDLVFAIGGCLLFSGYIVYDTYLINAKLSPDEFIMGAISLYLECVLAIPFTFSIADPFPFSSLALSTFVCVIRSIVFRVLTVPLCSCPVISILRLLNDLQER